MRLCWLRKNLIFMCFVWFLLAPLIYIFKSIALQSYWYTILSPKFQTCDSINYLDQITCIITLFMTSSSASVYYMTSSLFRVYVEYTDPLPMHITAAVWILISLLTVNEPSTQHCIKLMSSAVNINVRLITFHE